MVPQSRNDLRRLLPLAIGALFSTALWAPAQDSLLSSINPGNPAVHQWDQVQRAGNSSIAATQFVSLDGDKLLALAPGSTLKVALDLFGERSVVEMRYFQRQLEHKIFVGEIAGDQDATIVFGVAPSGIGSAVIEFGNGEAYELNYTGTEDVHGLHKIDHNAVHPHASCGVTEDQHVTSPVSPNDPVKPTLGGPPVLQGVVATDIDLCTFYTAQAKNAAGGKTAIENTIATRTGTANTGGQNTGAGYNLRLVLTQETNYTESGNMSSDLSRFRQTSGSYMTEVHGLRNQYGGDLMQLIVNTGSYCGIAYLMTNVSQSFRTSAFGVTRRSCFGQHSYTHEMGHNMGCAHDRQNASSGAYSYSFGARTPNNQYRSIMSYSPGSRINKWSGPNVTHGGMTLGSATEDNTRSLNNAKDVVALFKPTQVGGTVPTLTSISTSSISNYIQFGVQIITLTGTEISTVTSLTVGSKTPSFTIVDATTMTFMATSGYDIGINMVEVANGAGASNPVSLLVTASHPSVVEVPFVHLQGASEDYAAYTDVNWSTAYFVSTSNSPAVLPGVVSFGIGNNFNDLIYVTTLVAGQGGETILPITAPVGFGGGARLHWQVVSYDQSNVTFPVEVSNVGSVLHL